MKREAKLILDDGTVFCGWSFGAEKNTVGEVVFNTAMMGYPESLTDPSYAGQILVTTFPLMGNYGVPETSGNPLPTFMESDKIHVKGLIVADYSENYSHWNAKESLSSWLKREGIPAISGIDTRRLTKLIREHGVMRGRIEVNSKFKIQNSNLNIEEDYGSVNWVEKVSCKEVITYKPSNSQLSTLNSQLKTVVLVDCGVKANIIRCLLKRGVEVIRVPWDYDFNQLEFDGLFLANGPGDPEQCTKTVEHIRTFLNNKEVKPLMGICLGNQLLARAAGAKTYKLKYGHRSHNQPVMMVNGSGFTNPQPLTLNSEPRTQNPEPLTQNHKCFITSQNHGYAVDASTLPSDWEPLFVNMNDGSNEGIRHKTNPWFSAQFHPEACSGPTDTEWMFDEFVKTLSEERRVKSEEFSILNSQFSTTDKDSQLSTFNSQLSTVKKVLLLGSGALKIGQAGEFDYSGAQALKALKEEGVKSVLINPNIATVQTSEGVADKVYFQPPSSWSV